MRRFASIRVLAVVATILGLLGYPATASPKAQVTSRVQLQPQSEEANFVLAVYGQLRMHFYSNALDPSKLFNESLTGLSKYLKSRKVNFSPKNILPGTKDMVAQGMFKKEFVKAEALARAVKLKSHELAFVASDALLDAVDDSHTSFIDPKSWDYMLRGESGMPIFSGGIGVHLRRTEDGSVYVLEVYPDGPAERAGLKRFDRIIAVDGFPVPWELQYTVSMILGEKCSEVTLSVIRDGKCLDVKVERNDIVSPVAREEVITAGNEHFGYLHLYSFVTQEALDRTLAHVVMKGYVEDNVAGYIIDLRDNSGGQLRFLDSIFEIFLVHGTKCYNIQSAIRHSTYATGAGQITDLPMVVLVNDGSYSASEIFAAVMKEQKRAVIVGTRTGGAVSGARHIGLPYGSGMSVAIFQIFTAGGKTLEKVGVLPDIQVQLEDKDIAEGRDSQLEKAIHVLEEQTKK